jgi:hypothetical protein
MSGRWEPAIWYPAAHSKFGHLDQYQIRKRRIVISRRTGRQERIMMRQFAVSLSAILVLAAFNCGAWAQSPAPAPEATQAVQSVGSATIVTFQGKIVAVDTAKKQVTLEGPEGRKLTVDVKNPANLKAAKVGEPYSARYYDIFTVRKKRPGETVQNAVTAGVWTTNPLGVPGGSRAVQITVLVTVAAIDQANGTVTVKAADGTTETVKARNPHNLKLIKVGDELVIVRYKAMAISLQKQSGGGAS